MSQFDIAMRRIEQGHRLKFYQDFYGRQWVRIVGGIYFWRNASLSLKNEEVVALKTAIAKRRGAMADRQGDAGAAREADLV